MADRDVYGLIIALTTWIADPARGNLILNPTGVQKREIFSHNLPDDNTVAETATVVRLGAPSPRQFDPFERLGVQIFTRGLLLDAVIARCETIYGVLLDAQRRPIRSLALNAHWMCHLIDPSAPQPLPYDERKRALGVINCNVQAGLLPE